MGAFEVLTGEVSVPELISKDTTEAAILRAAMDGGMRCFLEGGLVKIIQGIASSEELLRRAFVRDEEDSQTCPKCGGAVPCGQS